MSKIIGLDISTSVTGITVLDDSVDYPHIVLMDHITFEDCDDVWEKADKFNERFTEICIQNHPIDAVYIEEALLNFRTGLSNAQTITTLVKFNGLCSYIVRNHMGSSPSFVASTTARKNCGIKIIQRKKCDMSAKEQVFTWALAGPLSKLEFEKTRTGKYKTWNYDRVDSFVIALHGLKELQRAT